MKCKFCSRILPNKEHKLKYGCKWCYFIAESELKNDKKRKGKITRKLCSRTP